MKAKDTPPGFKPEDLKEIEEAHNRIIAEHAAIKPLRSNLHFFPRAEAIEVKDGK